MSDLLANLNPEQFRAVTLPPQSALILAGAGSGKTRVLTTRIAWLIQTGQARPSGILAVTFTNKAAREMLTRLSAMLPINLRGMWVGTFHGLANRFLRAHHREAGLPQLFQILDAGDQLSAVKRLLKAMNVDDEKFPPKNVMWFINGAKESGQRPRDIAANDEHNRRFIELYAAYEAQCQREGVVDFAELLLRTYEVLARNEVLCAHYRERFAHILVDEFQDTNELQYKWLKLIGGAGTGSPAAMFAVGDDDQSIYAFRGARVGNMLDFERDFHVDTLIKLEQNYRSHGNILDAANALIKNNGQRLGKNLWTEAGHGEPVRVYEAPADLDEARWLVGEVKNLILEGSRRSEIAVLYRSNAQSRVIEQLLFADGIPYKVYGGLRFFERAEIKHAIAYLRLMANPDDDTSFARVVNFPARGIGARSIEALNDAARTRDMANPAGISLMRAVPLLQGKAGASLGAFVGLIDAMRGACQGLPLTETIDHVLDHSGLRAHYRNDREGRERLENLDELVSAAANFIAEDEDSLAEFLAHAALEAGDNQAEAGQDAVQLMTVHSAKGLEFDQVFITGLEDGLFPHENSILEKDGLDEERRLMYVAITRARRRLYLSFAQTRMLHGQTRYSLKSRFLDELPESLLKWLTPRISAARGNLWQGDDDFAPAARPAWAKAAAAADSGYRIGQNVRHAKFGAGVIVGAEGNGQDARVQVNFGRAGVKWLALAYAKLENA
ncbi:MAG: UvrD-helicase domain-containing protein [Burkholderiales bacterium]|nr:UvrD-helicase domain-containing protein [Burkholderiales bacterium]